MFFIQENVAFNLSVTKLIQQSTTIMKTKLCSFARKQILPKRIRNF